MKDFSLNTNPFNDLLTTLSTFSKDFKLYFGLNFEGNNGANIHEQDSLNQHQKVISGFTSLTKTVNSYYRASMDDVDEKYINELHVKLKLSLH